MRSALLHPDVVRAYLEKECTLNRMLGPFTLVRMPPLHINRFRFIPKCHNMGKWCLITDVSHPPGCSVNGGISSEVCSLSYTTVEQVAAGYTGGALLAKIDIEAAYRLILVHPHDCQLQAVEWEGKFYINPMVQFRHRLAPKIFNAVADTLEWCMRRRGIRHVFHYLDDFIVFGPPHSVECAEALSIHALTWESQPRTTSRAVLRLASHTWASRWTQWPPNHIFPKTSSSASGSASLNGVIGNAVGAVNSSPSLGSCTMHAKEGTDA